jgi:signal transduction histidine kinase
LYRSTGRVSRRQVGVFAGASVVPTAANVVYVLEIGPIPAFDATPYAFLAFGILTFGAVVGFRFLESRPVGRSTLFESLSEPVVVLDERNRIVDSNPAARALPGVDVGPDGDPLADAVPTLGRAVATGADTVAIGDRLFDVETNPVTDDRGNQRGRLVLLTDVTDRHRREVALRDLQEATNRMLERDSVEGVAAVAAAAARRVLGADRAVVRLREGDRLLPVATAVPDGGDATDEGRSRDSPEGDASTVTPAPWADGTVRTGDLDDEGHPDPVSVDDSVHGDALRAGRPVATEGQGPPPARTADGTSTDTDHPVVTLHVPLGDGGVLSAVDPDPRPGALASAPGTVGRADDETVASAGAVPSPSDGSGDSVGAGAPDDADPTTVASTAAAAASDREDGRDVGDRTAALADLLGTSAGASVARARRRADLAERTDRLDRFASVLSHDLRNPLSVAQGYLELAREAVEDPTVSGYLESSADGIERLDALIDDLLLLARDGPGEDRLAPVSVTAVAKEAWDTVDTGDATLVADGAVRVEADRSNLRRAIENLFRNAIEHGEADAVRVEPTPDGERPGFRVADDGHGVPPALEESLFERGVSGDDGTGLGLAVVRSVVEGHGWTIAYDPSPAGGAQFSVYFDDRSD